MDFEGRNIRLDFDNFSIMSLYLPSGTNVDRLDFKFKFKFMFKWDSIVKNIALSFP